jgi:hypothetical protein
MKIYFYKSGNKNLGSERIYINNLSKWLKPFTKFTKTGNQIIKGPQIFIMSKYCSPEKIHKAKSFGKTLVGLIHPSDSNKYEMAKLKTADFLIVGSVEEKSYYQSYSKNVFRFPQIEDYKLSLKKHTKKNKIIFGYHGNLENLESSNQNYKIALEKLSKKIDLEFWVIYDKSLGKWKNQPNIKIKTFNWSENNLIKFLKKIDIGVVPSTNSFFLDKDFSNSNFLIKLFKKYSDKIGRNNDFIIKFKNNANAGRSHLFHQAGIPIVADFWPSHFEILSNDNCGYLAHSLNSWYYGLEALAMSHTVRNKTSISAFHKFNQLYKIKDWSKSLYINIKKLYDNNYDR